jgi:hypothetical protein
MTKPKCKLIGTDGNVFVLIGKASTALNQAGFKEQAKEMTDKVFACGSYNEALQIIMHYVEVS